MYAQLINKIKIKMKFKICLIYLILETILSAHGYKILAIFTIPGQSHINYNGAVIKSLVKAGHRAVVVTPFPAQISMENCTIIDISEGMDIYVNKMPVEEAKSFSTFQMLTLISDVEETYCNKMMELEEVKKMFQSKEKLFDVIMMETFLVYECYLPLAKKWNIPVVATISTRSWNIPDAITGTPRLPSVMRSEVGAFKTFDVNLNTFLGRLMNTWSHLVFNIYTSYFMSLKGRQFYKNHKEVLEAYDGYRDIQPSLVFYNNHFTLQSRPMSSNAIDIGGIHLEKEKSLPKIFQNFVDSAEHGVIIFTLGSVVRSSTVDDKSRLAFKEAFREIPQKVIWKYEDKMEDVPTNVLLHKWIPQRDLLAHDKVRAVISHCGLSGTYEITNSRKPVIATPLFGDQIANADILKNQGAAIVLEWEKISKETVLDAITEILNNTRYLENMQRLSQRLKDRPMTPQQSVVYWTEYVIRHNGALHLKTLATDLYWFQYFLIDVLVFITCTIAVSACIVYIVLKKVTKYVRSRKQINVNKKNL